MDVAPDSTARLSGQSDGEEAAAQPLGSFDAGIGNPVAMMFL